MTKSLSRAVRRTLKILIIENDDLDARLIARMLERARIQIIVKTLDNVPDALDILGDERFDCALVGLELPNDGAAQVLRAVSTLRRDLPVIIIAESENEDRGSSAVGLGAQDYLIKGDFNRRHLSRAILYAIERKRLTSELERMSLELRQTVSKLKLNNATLVHRVRVDPLTELGNRLALDEHLNRLIAESKRGRQFVLVMCDIDHFKRFNDKYGHPEGDTLLIEFGRILVDAVREIDFVGRYGGEEFAMLLVDTDEKGAVCVAERIREGVELAFRTRGNVTASFGVRAFSPSIAGPDALLKEADQLMYCAKQFGRNRVVAWSETLRSSTMPPPPRARSGCRTPQSVIEQD